VPTKWLKADRLWLAVPRTRGFVSCGKACRACFVTVIGAWALHLVLAANSLHFILKDAVLQMMVKQLALGKPVRKQNQCSKE